MADYVQKILLTDPSNFTNLQVGGGFINDNFAALFGAMAVDSTTYAVDFISGISATTGNFNGDVIVENSLDAMLKIKSNENNAGKQNKSTLQFGLVSASLERNGKIVLEENSLNSSAASLKFYVCDAAIETLGMTLNYDQSLLVEGYVLADAYAFADNTGTIGNTTNPCKQSDHGDKSTAVGFIIQRFWNSNGNVGNIVTSGTSTAYSTSSDPRLKSILAQIAAYRTLQTPLIDFPALQMVADAVENNWIGKFHFLSDPTVEVWGYNAHALIDNQAGFGGTEGEGGRNLTIGDELTPAVFNADGKEITPATHVTPAGVDQGKRVPLLEAAVYELLKKNEALEARIAVGGL